MNYAVHVYAVYRLKVEGIEANSQAEAVQKAVDALGDREFLNQSLSVPLSDGRLTCMEWADADVDFLVDEENDETHERSEFLHWDAEKRSYVPGPALHEETTS